MLCARAAPMEGSGCAADPPAREKFLKFCKSAIDIPTKTRYTIEAVRNAAQGPVAQLDRVFDYESKGRGFESRRAHHNLSENHCFQTFLLFISDIKPSKKAKNRGLSPPVFPISCVKVRNKSACA